MQARPHHCRLPTLKPNILSAMTASSTMPPESTAWTTDRGAIAIAATCMIQAPAPMSIPIANHFWLHSDTAVRSGCRMSTLTAEHAPLCL